MQDLTTASTPTIITIESRLRKRLDGRPLYKCPYRTGFVFAHAPSNILNTYQNRFNTSRSLYNAELNGDWLYRNWRFSPTTGFTYYNEYQYQFINSINIPIPGQRIALGQFNFGPEISYLYLSHRLKKINTHVSFEGIYNFDINGKQHQVSNGFLDGFSGRIKLGSEIVFPSGFSLSPAIQYDGLGRNTFSAIQGQIQISIPLDNLTLPVSQKNSKCSAPLKEQPYLAHLDRHFCEMMLT